MSRKEQLHDRLAGLVLQAAADAEDRTHNPQRFNPADLQRLGNSIRMTQKRLREWLMEYQRLIEEETREECRRLWVEWYKRKHPNEPAPVLTTSEPTNGTVKR